MDRFTSVVGALLSLEKLTDTKRGFVGAKVFYREHAIAYSNHSLKTCGGPEAFTSTTIF